MKGKKGLHHYGLVASCTNPIFADGPLHKGTVASDNGRDGSYSVGGYAMQTSVKHRSDYLIILCWWLGVGRRMPVQQGRSHDVVDEKRNTVVEYVGAERLLI